MTGTTPITHYRLCNGKLRHRSAACGLTVIPFLRGSGVINKTDALRLSNPPLPEENLQQRLILIHGAHMGKLTLVEQALRLHKEYYGEDNFGTVVKDCDYYPKVAEIL
ncbi:hypothetical protein BANRA_05060 [Escherichia coli]|nr:hypothetical protein BANRA_05060 [Escherichia coli]